MEKIAENKENVTRACLQLNDKIYPVYEGHNTVGRNPDAVINIKHLNVSKTHAVITVVDQNCHYLSDLKSSNGTILDNVQLLPLQLYKLKNGASVKFGDVFCTYKKLDDGKLLNKSLVESQVCGDSIYGASTQNVDFPNLPEGINFNELPTQVFTAKDLTINEMPTQMHNFDDMDDSTDDSIDFITMQKSTETQRFNNSGGVKVLPTIKSNDPETDHVESPMQSTVKSKMLNNSSADSEEQPISNSTNVVQSDTDDSNVVSQGSVIRPVAHNSKIISDSEGSETEDELPRFAAIKSVKTRSRNVIDSDSEDTEDYDFKGQKSKYHISDDSETDVELEKNEDFNAGDVVPMSLILEEKEETSMASLRLSESIDGAGADNNEEVRAPFRLSKKVLPLDHLYCQAASQTQEQFEKIEEKEKQFGENRTEEAIQTDEENEDRTKGESQLMKDVEAKRESQDQKKNEEHEEGSQLEKNRAEDWTQTENRKREESQRGKDADAKEESQVQKKNKRQEKIDSSRKEEIATDKDSQKVDSSLPIFENDEEFGDIVDAASEDKEKNEDLSVSQETSSLLMLQRDEEVTEDIFTKTTQTLNFSLASNDERQSDSVETGSETNAGDQLKEKHLNDKKISEEKKPPKTLGARETNRSGGEPCEGDDICLQATQTLNVMKESNKEDFLKDEDDGIFMLSTQILEKSINPFRDLPLTSWRSEEEEDGGIFLHPTQALENLHGEGPSSTPRREAEETDTQALESLLADVEETKKALEDEEEEDILPPTQVLESPRGEDLEKDVFLPPMNKSPRSKAVRQKPPVEEDNEDDFMQPTQALEALHDDGTPFNKVEDQLQEIFASQSTLCTQQLVDVLNNSKDDDIIEDSFFVKEESLTEERVKNILEDGGLEVNRLSGKGGIKTYSKKSTESHGVSDMREKGTRRKSFSEESDTEDIEEKKKEETTNKNSKGKKKGNLVDAGEKSEVAVDSNTSEANEDSDIENKKKGKRKKQKVNDQTSKMEGDKESKNSTTNRRNMDDQDTEKAQTSGRKQKVNDQEEKEEGSKIESDKESQSSTRSRKKLKMVTQNKKEQGLNVESKKESQKNTRNPRKPTVDDEQEKDEEQNIESDKESRSSNRIKSKQKVNKQQKEEESNIPAGKDDSQTNTRSRRKLKMGDQEQQDEGSKIKNDQGSKSNSNSPRKQKMDDHDEREKISKVQDDKDSQSSSRSRRKPKVDDKDEEDEGFKMESKEKSQTRSSSRRKQKSDDQDEKEEEKPILSSRTSKRTQKVYETDTKVDDNKVSQSGTRTRRNRKVDDQNDKKNEEDKQSQNSSTTEKITRSSRRQQNLDVSDDPESNVESVKRTVRKRVRGKSTDNDDSFNDRDENEGRGIRNCKRSLEVIEESRSSVEVPSASISNKQNIENEEPTRTRRTRTTPEAKPSESEETSTTRPKRKKETTDEPPETPTKKRAVPARSPNKRGLKSPSDSEDEFESKIPKMATSPKSKKATEAKEEDANTTSTIASVSTSSKESANKIRRLSANSRRQKREEEEMTPAKKTEVVATPERSKRVLKPKVVFTMMDNPALEGLIRRLGGSVVDSVDSCTVLVTESVKRTPKLLCAVGQGKPICSPQWLQACKKAMAFVDPWMYVLVDKLAEKKWNFSLRESISRATNAKLLQDYTFQVMAGKGQDSEKVLKGAIEACGGKCVAKNLAKCDSSHLIVVANENQKASYSRVVKQNPKIRVVQPEAIFDGTLRQDFQFDNFLLS